MGKNDMNNRGQNSLLMGELLGGIQAPSLKGEPSRREVSGQTPAEGSSEGDAKNLGHGGVSRIRNRFSTSLTVNREKYDKIKAIAICNGLNINEVMDAAMELFINEYEKRNGPITSRESRISAMSLISTRKSKSHED